jgi:hypothetical protein
MSEASDTSDVDVVDFAADGDGAIDANVSETEKISEVTSEISEITKIAETAGKISKVAEIAEADSSNNAFLCCGPNASEIEKEIQSATRAGATIEERFEAICDVHMKAMHTALKDKAVQLMLESDPGSASKMIEERIERCLKVKLGPVMAQLFNDMDTNHDFVLDKDEIRAFVHAYCEWARKSDALKQQTLGAMRDACMDAVKANPRTPAAAVRLVEEVFDHLDEPMAELTDRLYGELDEKRNKLAEEMAQHCDPDGSGEITKAEFLDKVQKEMEAFSQPVCQAVQKELAPLIAKMQANAGKKYRAELKAKKKAKRDAMRAASGAGDGEKGSEHHHHHHHHHKNGAEDGKEHNQSQQKNDESEEKGETHHHHRGHGDDEKHHRHNPHSAGGAE